LPVNLPNGITVARILAAPVIFVLILGGGFGQLVLVFIVFVVAAVSDIWDGYLARRRGQITDFGKLADPIADKLLVLATFIPFYIVSSPRPAPGEVAAVPYWDVLPLWVLIVVLGRELLITLFRAFAKQKGVVIAAGKAGKGKTLFQNLFMGGEILWLALRDRALERGWDTPFWSFWKVFHGSFVAITLAIAVLLTAYSMIVYLWQYRALVTRPGST
jgi:CDP-diacylglycerol--glycerol-3-phosphate 3-phosphatidyltransferase